MKLKVMMEPEIRETANDLQRIADEYPTYPVDILKGLAKGCSPGVEPRGPHPRHKRQFSYNGYPVHITFTLTVLSVCHRVYQLSMSDMRGKVLCENVVDILVRAFFRNGKFCEIPSVIHGPRVRQFIQDQQDRDDG